MPAVPLDKRIAPTVDGFVAAFTKGDADAACAFVVEDNRGNCISEFEQRSADFVAPRGLKLITQHIVAADNSNSGENMAAILYAARIKAKAGKEDSWQSMRLTLYWEDGQKPAIDSWNYNGDGAAPAEVTLQGMSDNITYWTNIGLGIGAVLFLIGIMWLVKRRPHVIAPDRQRREGAAVTKRHDD